MSYDALVWLLVGLGVGVAGSLLLLMGYAGLERARLGRRRRKARAAMATPPEAKPVPVERPPGSGQDVATTTASKPVAMQPVPEDTKPTVAVTPAPAASLGPRPVQSVEALFAEAFANDKLPVPEPGGKST